MIIFLICKFFLTNSIVVSIMKKMIKNSLAKYYKIEEVRAGDYLADIFDSILIICCY